MKMYKRQTVSYSERITCFTKEQMAELIERITRKINFSSR